MLHTRKKSLCLLLSLLTALSLIQPALAAGVSYMPGVTPEMSDSAYWAQRQEGAGEVILTLDEIRAFNAANAAKSGTMVMDLKSAADTFDGRARNEAIRTSSKADAEYYFGWTYGGTGKRPTGPFSRI